MPSKLIKRELLAIQSASRDHILRPEAVVLAAKNKRSPLHKQFEWDDSKAAKAHRLWQARQLITLHIVGPNQQPEMVSLSIDRVLPGGGYRRIGDVLSNRELAQAMLDDALAELERVQFKYSRVESLTSVWNEVEKVKTTRRSKKAA